MGPRQLSRGIFGTDTSIEPVAQASMGPRQLSRGIGKDGEPGILEFSLLQWGHGN